MLTFSARLAAHKPGYPYPVGRMVTVSPVAFGHDDRDHCAAVDRRQRRRSQELPMDAQRLSGLSDGDGSALRAAGRRPWSAQ